MTSPEIASLAAALVARAGSTDVAFLQDGRRVLWARPREPGSPFGATVILIQGVHASEPALARKLLRARIHATREPGPFAHGMVKIAARRLTVVGTVVAAPGEGDVDPALELVEVRPSDVVAASPEPSPASPRLGPDPTRSHANWLELAASLVPPRPADRPRFELDRAVGAVLVSPSGEPIAASANTNARDRTRHAELNVLAAAWALQKRKLAPGSRLYATLEPCKMCAGLAWELAEEPASLEVYYREPDPGPGARDSILDPASNARRRFARTRAEREATCLRRVLA